MYTIKKSITINAPLEDVFEYFSEPDNLPEVWPSLVEVKDFVDDPVERSFDYVYEMAGVRFEGHAETLEFEPYKRVMTQSREGNNLSVYHFERAGDMTRVTIEIDYTIPSWLLSKLGAPLIRRINEREVTNVLNNLKDRMELAAGIDATGTQGVPPFVVH